MLSRPSHHGHPLGLRMTVDDSYASGAEWIRGRGRSVPRVWIRCVDLGEREEVVRLGVQAVPLEGLGDALLVDEDAAPDCPTGRERPVVVGGGVVPGEPDQPDRARRRNRRAALHITQGRDLPRWMRGFDARD